VIKKLARGAGEDKTAMGVGRFGVAPGEGRFTRGGVEIVSPVEFVCESETVAFKLKSLWRAMGFRAGLLRTSRRRSQIKLALQVTDALTN
jgi:hypothetical protein